MVARNNVMILDMINFKIQVTGIMKISGVPVRVKINALVAKNRLTIGAVFLILSRFILMVQILQILVYDNSFIKKILREMKIIIGENFTSIF